MRVEAGRARASRRPSCLPALLLAAASLGCRSPRDAGSLVIAHEAELASLDPLAATDSIAKSVLPNIYDTLADLDRDMQLRPALALSWSTLNETTWIAHLRPGVRTHDGGVLTGADVKFSLDRARRDPASSLVERLATIEDVALVEALQIRIRTREPDPLLMHRLADIFIAPRNAASTLATRPVGTGPYRYLGSSGVLNLEAFVEHWRGQPRIGRVRFVTVKPGDATLDALRQKAVDVLRFVPEPLVDRIALLPGVRVVSHPSSRALYLWMNSEPRPSNPLADRKVRQALSLALDRKALVERLAGHGAALTQFFPPGVFGHLPGLSRLAHDPEAAGKLLREAGYPAGFDTTLTHVSGTEALTEAIRDMLGEVGVRVKLELREWPDLLARWRAARLQFFFASWTFSGESSLFLKECLFTRDPRALSAWNPGYSNPRLDALITRNFRTFDEPERLEQSEALIALLHEEMPLLPLFSRDDLYAVRSRVKWRPRIDGRMQAAEMALAADDQ